MTAKSNPSSLGSALIRWIIQNPWSTILVVFTFLMLYQATLPRGLTLNPKAHTLLLEIFPSDTFKLSKFDIIGNVVPYYIYGHFLFLWACRKKPFRLLVLPLTFFGSIGMSLAVEFVQFFNLHRGSAIWDVISGGIGGLMAMGSGYLHHRFLSQPLKQWIQKEFVRNPWILAAAFVSCVALWDAAQPFYVISDMHYLVQNVKRSNLIPFEPPGRDVREQLGLRTTVSKRPNVSRDFLGSLGERFVLYLSLLILLFVAFPKRRLKPVLFFAGIVGAVEGINLVVVGGRFDITRIVIALICVPIAFPMKRLFLGATLPGVFLLLTLWVVYALATDLRPFVFGEREVLTAHHFIPLIYHFLNPDVMVLANIFEAIAIVCPFGVLLYWALVRTKPGVRTGEFPSAWIPCIVCFSFLHQLR